MLCWFVVVCLGYNLWVATYWLQQSLAAGGGKHTHTDTERHGDIHRQTDRQTNRQRHTEITVKS